MGSSTAATGRTPATTVGELGEFETIAELVACFVQEDGVLVGPGDDAALVVAPGERVLVCTDVLVDGRHFRRDWAEAADIGRRAAAQSLADVAAMGGRATAVTVGLVTPEDMQVAWLVGMAEGLAEECAAVGASVVGGDLTRGSELVISVTATGTLLGEPVRRNGARPGDLVALRGRQGWAAAGLAVLGRGFRSPRVLVEAYRRPDVPYAAGPEAAALGATAMVDVSDGLLADLAHVAEASGVAIDLRTAAFEVDEPLQAVGAALGVDPLGFVLGGGDDHALAATFPAGTDLPEPWRVVGAVAAGEGVTVDGADWEGPTGFRHF